MTKFKIYIFLMTVLTSCAVQIPPSGGPPDKTPPELLEVFPLSNTLNFNEDYVRFEFSKYMNKSKVIENLFISPDVDVNYDWSGKTLDIEFEEELKQNTTYSVSLGTDYSDLKGNKPEMSYSIIFSTGNQIDSGMIIGKLYHREPDGAFIFAYLLDNIDPDTLNPSHNKPDYRTQIGSNGIFRLVALKPGKYRIFAIKDQMKDGIYDPGTDGFSSAQNDVIVNYESIPKVNLKLGPPIDKTSPMLYSVEALTRSTLIAEFSENIDSASINSNIFVIKDTTLKNKVDIKSAFITHGNANQVTVITETPLDTSYTYSFRVLNVEGQTVMDTVGNMIQDSAAAAYFYASFEPDTNELKLVEIIPKDSAQNIATDSYLEFIFNNSIKVFEDDIIIRLHPANSTDNIIIAASYPQENIVRIKSIALLESDEDYTLKLKLTTNVLDTTYILNFTTADERSYGGISGIIVDSSEYAGSYLLILSSKESTDEYRIYTRTKKWSMDRLPPGEYTLEISSDINDNEKYDYGAAFPWKESEPFDSLEGTIIIKPRWTVEDFKIIYFGKGENP